MDVFLLIISTTCISMLLWLNFLATIAIRHDKTLEQFQRVGQTICVWLIPFIGSTLVLKFVYEHSPKAIPTTWIPWPFKSMVLGKYIKPNPHPSSLESDVVLNYEPHQHHHIDSD